MAPSAARAPYAARSQPTVARFVAGPSSSPTSTAPGERPLPIKTAAKGVADVSQIEQLNALLVDTPLSARSMPNRLAAFSRVAIFIVFSALVTAFVLRSASWARDTDET